MNDSQLQYAQLFGTPAGAASAVARVRQNEYDLSFLNSLANLTADPETWKRLRDAGIIDLFIDMTLRMPPVASESESSSTFPTWVLPLQGLFNSMVGIQRSPGTFQVAENREATLKILNQSPAICRRVAEEKTNICGSEAHAEDLRRSVVMWTQAIWTGAAMLSLNDIRRDLKGPLIELATWCWLYASSVDLLSRAATALADVLEQPDSTKTDLEQLIASARSYEHLISRSNSILRDLDVVDECLANNMSLLTGFTRQTVHMELTRWFPKLGMHHEVMTALRRQLTSLDRGEVVWNVLEYSGMLVVNIVNESASPTDELTNLIAHNSLVPLLGGVLLRCTQASRESASWSSLLALLKHTCTCTSPTCRVRTSTTYISSLRTHLSQRWWPMLQKLHAASAESSSKRIQNETSNKGSQVQSEWFILGRMAGLEEAIERRRHEQGEGIEGCWWVECVRLVEPADPTRNPALKKCSGCKKALYCTTECQNKDWKAHKKHCTTWKNAAA